MEIQDIGIFVRYCHSIRNRTLAVVKEIPPDKIEWKPNSSAFSFGDIIRHMASLQRYMFAETIQGNESLYPGHASDLANGYEEVRNFLDRTFTESMEIISEMSTNELLEKCKTPAGIQISVWKWLRAMIEHEIHHRGQIYTYLRLIEAKSPPIYGLTSEEVYERSKKS